MAIDLIMKRKRYTQASKANTKRFCEAQIQDQFTEVENILNVLHRGCNLSDVSVLIKVIMLMIMISLLKMNQYIIHQIIKLKRLNVMNITAMMN